MPERLTAVEQSTLALDTVRTPAVVGTVEIFEPGPDGFDEQRLQALIADRIRYVPRYRQRVLPVPGRLAGPVWVDDQNFDLSFHVRRATVPRPGTAQQVQDFAARVMCRRLDRSRPLWELYLVDGIEGGRFALVSKAHPALVDGIETVHLSQVLLDETPDQTPPEAEDWHPLPEPNAVELMAGAVQETVRDPGAVISNLQHAVTDAASSATAWSDAPGLGGSLGELAAEVLAGNRPANRGQLAGPVTAKRRVAVATAALDDLRSIAVEQDHTVNDVVLSLITGGLRRWLLTRGEAPVPGASLTAMVPMSMTDTDGVSSLGSTVVACLMRLPIGADDPLARLDRIGQETQAHKDSGQAVGARSLTEIAGFVPPTLHTLGARVAGAQPPRAYDIMITNAPGPQHPVYLAEARMTAGYPVLPLAPEHLLAIGVTSFDGQLAIGLNGDHAGLDDLDVLALCIADELADWPRTTDGDQRS
jgi:diacylglycerol O-acyltransferase